MRIATLALAFAIGVLPVVSAPALAQESSAGTKADEQILLKQVMNDKRAVYAQNLGLTESESRAFWPIYDEYEAKVKKLDDAFLKLVDDYANKYDTLTDADAKAMLDTKLKIEKDRMALKQKYAPKIAKVLPGKKALRYSQLETRIEIVVRSRVYSLIPLAR
jgi:hypothetical protein